MTAPVIHRELDLRCSPATAFAAWTDRIDAWWPPGHRMSGDPDGVVVMEPGVGGRFYERTPDGREVEYGRVLAWDPPGHLQYAFFAGTGAATPTRVTVRFASSATGCRVTVQHGPGDCPPDRFGQTAPRFHAGWDRVLPAFFAHLHPPLPPRTDP